MEDLVSRTVVEGRVQSSHVLALCVRVWSGTFFAEVRSPSKDPPSCQISSQKVCDFDFSLSLGLLFSGFMIGVKDPPKTEPSLV